MNDQIITLAERERDQFIRSRQSIKNPSHFLKNNGQRNYTPLFSIDTVLSQPNTETEWTVESIVLAHGLTILGGLPGHGKSWFSQFLAKSVASGEPFLGKFEVKQGAVLVVDREVPTKRLKKRWSAVGITTGSPILFYSYSDPFKLDNPSDAERIKSLVKENNIQVVIIDTFNRSHSNKDLNSAGEVSGVFETIKALLELCSVVLIHHLTKASFDKEIPAANDLYGSIDFLAETDLLFLFKKKGKQLFEVYNQKSRDSEEIAPFTMSLEVNNGLVDLIYEGEKDAELTSPKAREQRIIEILKAGKIKREELVKQLVAEGDKEGTISNSLTKLRSQGTIKSELIGNEAYYYLPETYREPFPTSESVGSGKPENVQEETVSAIQNVSQPQNETIPKVESTPILASSVIEARSDLPADFVERGGNYISDLEKQIQNCLQLHQKPITTEEISKEIKCPWYLVKAVLEHWWFIQKKGIIKDLRSDRWSTRFTQKEMDFSAASPVIESTNK